jgi:hypothetical protein
LPYGQSEQYDDVDPEAPGDPIDYLVQDQECREAFYRAEPAVKDRILRHVRDWRAKVAQDRKLKGAHDAALWRARQAGNGDDVNTLNMAALSFMPIRNQKSPRHTALATDKSPPRGQSMAEMFGTNRIRTSA